MVRLREVVEHDISDEQILEIKPKKLKKYYTVKTKIGKSSYGADGSELIELIGAFCSIGSSFKVVDVPARIIIY